MRCDVRSQLRLAACGLRLAARDDAHAFNLDRDALARQPPRRA
ncbi:hypothetical protein BURMUCF1_A1053, partial [Burkholderia multivorans ATCC BAA-247]